MTDHLETDRQISATSMSLLDLANSSCKEMGHFSSECPQEKRQPKPLLNWAHHPEMPAEDAWNLLKEADSTRDLDDIKEAFEVFCRNSPETTIQEIETRFRAEGFTTHLVGMEKEEMYDYLTNVNLQGEIGKQYSLGFQLSAKSRRQKMYQSMLAESPEENFERLADCGLTVKKNCIVCNHVSSKTSSLTIVFSGRSQER